jgi:hypothetical protein
VVTVTGDPVEFDVVVSDAVGRVRWRRLVGRSWYDVALTAPVPSGAGVALRDTYVPRSQSGAPLPPGTYSVRATMPGGADASAGITSWTTTFVVER